jgi:putative transposase
MLTDIQVERLFSEWRIPEAGRDFVREIRTTGPVRDLQSRMDTVRTRFISKKMERALYAESRTVELPAIVLRENDKKTLEIWPQPVKLDIKGQSSNGKGTRVQHIPDLFLIENDRFLIEEWREEARLLRLAAERPQHFCKDENGIWHYYPVEEHLAKLGIDYRLRSADEHPRSFIANIWFLEDYSLETTPAVPDSEAGRLLKLLQEAKYLPHLQLVYEHKFSADHIFQMVLDGRVCVDLYQTTLSRTDDLIIYSDKVVCQADTLLRRAPSHVLPQSAYALRIGAKFLYDNIAYTVALLGESEVICTSSSGESTRLELSLVENLFRQELLASNGEQESEKEQDLDALLLKQNRLAEGLKRLDALRNPEGSQYSARTLRRCRAAIRGITSPQEQIEALMSCNDGNRCGRLPAEAIQQAELALKKHNKASNPTIFATYNFYVVMCDDAGILPMGKTAFYRWVKTREDVTAREGKRKNYQKTPIPLNYDYEHPVHGMLPHEVAYCDHTILNDFLKGIKLPDLGKPVLTLMADGTCAMGRAMYLSYRPACTESVLMCLRDYVRRHGRLPRVLVLDNGKEFHSEALKLFCSIFNIHIRWRRRSRPRDSTMVERMLGATEQEVISSLDGNSLALKDPRMVSTTHHPDKHIRWTLPALYGSIEHYLFNVHPNRIHPRLGISPCELEKRLRLECGAREHVMVRYDTLFKLMTSPHSGKSTRAIDRIRGVWVDGQYYWNALLATAKKDECVEVRVEMWHARVVYLCFRGQWIVGQARDGGRLEGRFRSEYEQQRREENRRARTAASNDKKSASNSRKRVALWEPEVWDERLREQGTEEYYLYSRLGMTEVLPDAKNVYGTNVELALPRGSDLGLIRAIEGEPDELPSNDGDERLTNREASEVAVAAEPATASEEDYF